MLSKKAKENYSSSVFVELTDENGLPLFSTFEAKFEYCGGFVKQKFINFDMLEADRSYNIHFYFAKSTEDAMKCAMRSLFESMEHLSHAGKLSSKVQLISWNLVYSMVGDDFSYAMYLKAFYQDEISRLERIKEDAILETQKYRQKFKGTFKLPISVFTVQ